MVRLQLDPDDSSLLVRTPMVLEEDMTSIVGKVFQDNSMFEISDAYSDSRFDPRSKRKSDLCSCCCSWHGCQAAVMSLPTSHCPYSPLTVPIHLSLLMPLNHAANMQLRSFLFWQLIVGGIWQVRQTG